MAVLDLRFCARAFSSCGKWGATLHRGARVSHYHGLSCCGAQAPDAQAQQLWLTGPVALRHVGSYQTRARTRVPCIGRQTLNHCGTREAPTKLLFGQHWAWTALWVNLQLHWVGIFQDVDFGEFPFMTLVMKVISLHLPKFQLLSYRAHFFPLQVQVMVIKPPWVSVLWINPNFLLFLHHNQTWTDKPKITKRFYGKCLCAHSYDHFCLVHILEKILVQK